MGVRKLDLEKNLFPAESLKFSFLLEALKTFFSSFQSQSAISNSSNAADVKSKCSFSRFSNISFFRSMIKLAQKVLFSQYGPYEVRIAEP